MKLFQHEFHMNFTCIQRFCRCSENTVRLLKSSSPDPLTQFNKQIFGRKHPCVNENQFCPNESSRAIYSKGKQLQHSKIR